MKPRLIILNGPLGIGKSTLASKYADEHPITLRLDIDDIRTYISHWRDYDEQSADSSKKMALAMAKVHLSVGYDVVIPQIIRKAVLLESFEQVALEADADFKEVLLLVSKEEAVRRFKERSYAQGYETGFRPGGLIDTGGREKKLSTMYDDMISTTNKRPNTIIIEPEYGNIDSTYGELIERISR